MLTLNEINQEMGNLNDWSLEMDSLSKVFQFGHFRESLEFVNKVGEVAERLNHHPDVMINFDSVRLLLTTKCEKGLTKKDFEMAREIDKLS